MIVNRLRIFGQSHQGVWKVIIRTISDVNRDDKLPSDRVGEPGPVNPKRSCPMRMLAGSVLRQEGRLVYAERGGTSEVANSGTSI